MSSTVKSAKAFVTKSLDPSWPMFAFVPPRGVSKWVDTEVEATQLAEAYNAEHAPKRATSQEITVLKQGEQVVLLNIPSALTQEQAQELLGKLGAAVDQDYLYHVGAVENPVPYQQFKSKAKWLERLLAREPKNPAKDTALPVINQLCRELGY